MKKNIKSIALLAFLLATGYHGMAQNTGQKIGTNPTIKEASALLELAASNKGLLVPRVALTSIIVALPVTAPANALTVFNTATTTTGTNDVTPGYYYWSTPQSKWVRLLDEMPKMNPWELTGNAATVAGTNFLGTTDAQPLMFKTNNIKSGYISNLAADGNIGLGYNSLTGSSFATPGSNAINNIGIGANVLSAATSASTWSNIAIGNNALSKNTDPRYNTAIGDNSQMNSTTGRNNVSVGVSTLMNLTTGSLNTAVGGTALGAVTTGASNNAFGLTALAGVTTGSANIGIGQLAGTLITTGSYNTIIGNYSNGVPNPTGNRQLNIGDLISGTGLMSGVFPETNATAQEKIKKVGIAQSSDVISEVLDVNGTARVRSLPLSGTINSIYTKADGTSSVAKDQTFTGTRTVVADANGVLGYVASLPITAATEPWRIQNTTTSAIANTDNIYQAGKVAVGFTAADVVSAKQMEVKGDFKAQVTNGTVVYGTEVNSPLNPASGMHYWMDGATGNYRVATAGAASSTLEAQTVTTKNVVTAKATEAAMSSQNGTNSLSTIRTTDAGNFFMETYNVTGQYGSTISLQNDGLRLVHTNTNGALDPFPNNNRTEILVQKENGVGFDMRNAAGAVKANYWFPVTTGTTGQVMKQSGAGGKIVWADAATNYSYTVQETGRKWVSGKKVMELTADITLATNTNLITLPAAVASNATLIGVRFISKATGSISTNIIEYNGTTKQLILGTAGTLTTLHPAGDYYIIVEYVDPI